MKRNILEAVMWQTILLESSLVLLGKSRLLILIALSRVLFHKNLGTPFTVQSLGATLPPKSFNEMVL